MHGLNTEVLFRSSHQIFTKPSDMTKIQVVSKLCQYIHVALSRCAAVCIFFMSAF